MRIEQQGGAFEAVALRDEHAVSTPPHSEAPPDSDPREHPQAPLAVKDRVSPDPRRETDRYQLVTPYFSSSRDL